MDKSGQRERETEAALLIYADDPESVARRIAGMVRIADYRLLRQPSVMLRDLYFDTPDEALRSHGLAVRLRESGRIRLITLKGPSRPAGGGGRERLEIEVPWSKTALRRIVKELANRDVVVQAWRFDDDARPLTAMKSLGLQIVQGRETRRTIRDIVPADKKGPRLAELAIDSVAYRFGLEEIRLKMVEVEAKRQEGLPALAIITRGLTDMLKPTLREWAYGKLATGMAVEKLLRKGALEGLVSRDRNLMPAAYDKLVRYLKRSGAK